jgi:hypothetical protein
MVLRKSCPVGTVYTAKTPNKPSVETWTHILILKPLLIRRISNHLNTGLDGLRALLMWIAAEWVAFKSHLVQLHTPQSRQQP